MQNELDKFDNLWQLFTDAVKGALRKAAVDGTLDYDRAKAILAERSLCWQNDFDSEGRWIASIVKEDPEKGKKIRRILSCDMQFREENMEKPNVVPQAVGAIGGGAIGYGVAHAIGMGTVATIATTALPLAAGAIAGNVYANRRRSAAVDNVVNAYASQLDSYYHSVVALLNA